MWLWQITSMIVWGGNILGHHGICVGSWKVLIQINQLFQNQKWDMFHGESNSSNKRAPFSISSPQFHDLQISPRENSRPWILLPWSLVSTVRPPWHPWCGEVAATLRNSWSAVQRWVQRGAVDDDAEVVWSADGLKSCKFHMGGGFKYVLCSPLFGGRWSNLTHIFQMGWNHQLVQF